MTDLSDSGGPGAIAADQVIAALQQLDQLSIDQHAAVFERAHEQLRTLLTHGADQPVDLPVGAPGDDAPAPPAPDGPQDAAPASS